MPPYIMFHRYTQKGIENIKQSPARLEAFRKEFEAMGAKLEVSYLLASQYDIVTITEAPDDETIAKCALSVGLKGNVTTETLRAFTEEEYRRIIAEEVLGDFDIRK